MDLKIELFYEFLVVSFLVWFSCFNGVVLYNKYFLFNILFNKFIKWDKFIWYVYFLKEFYYMNNNLLVYIEVRVNIKYWECVLFVKFIIGVMGM